MKKKSKLRKCDMCGKIKNTTKQTPYYYCEEDEEGIVSDYNFYKKGNKMVYIIIGTTLLVGIVIGYTIRCLI